MALLNYTTSIAADKSVNEIHRILARHNVTQILNEYDGGDVWAVSFQILTPHGPKAFQLPANVAGVLAVMQRQKRAGKLSLPANRINHEQARRVAWRILKDWIEAQLALVESNQVTLDQVMLPYLQVQRGVSLYQVMSENHLALPPPSEDQ